MHNSSKQYNGDETGLQLDPRSVRVLAPRNENVYTEAGGTKEQLTVVITTRADGKLMPTAVVLCIHISEEFHKASLTSFLRIG